MLEIGHLWYTASTIFLSFFLSFFIHSTRVVIRTRDTNPRDMHQLNATQDAGARDKGTQECDQLKDEREHELQDTHVGFEATEVTYSHTFKRTGTSSIQ